MTRCWKQEEVKVVEVELLPLFVQLFLVSCLRQLSWGKHLPFSSSFNFSLPRLASLAVSHQNTIPLFFVFLSFVIWLYDCITDMVGDFSFDILSFFCSSFFFCTLFHFPSSSQLPPGNHFYPQVIIEKLWSFQLPILQPDLISYQVSPVKLRIILIILISDYCNYQIELSHPPQTLTIDLYAPLLLLVLLFSLMFTLLSCSCSRLSDQVGHLKIKAVCHGKIKIITV